MTPSSLEPASTRRVRSAHDEAIPLAARIIAAVSKDWDPPNPRATPEIVSSAPYAPELNPVELIWGYLKANPMANFAPGELAELVDQTDLATCVIARDQPLLRSFLEHCPLSLRLK